MRRKDLAEPSEGIWYYVWFKPAWELMIWDGPQRSHWTEWEGVAALLAGHYKIQGASEQSLLLPLQHSLPRGRVVYNNGAYILCHGDDFPSCYSKEGQVKTLISAFGLSKQALLGQVNDAVAQHEKMDEREKVALQAIIGPVPY